MQEFASYLAQLSTSFSAPLAERIAVHEQDLVGRVRKLAEDIDRQRQSAADRLAAQESDLVKRLNKNVDAMEQYRRTAAKQLEADQETLVAKLKALCDEVDRHRARVEESQATLVQALSTAVSPLQEAVSSSTNRAGQVVGEFASTKQAVSTMTVVVGKTHAAIWACFVLSLGSFATTLWLALR
jgi:chromosome segregation ATPase